MSQFVIQKSMRVTYLQRRIDDLKHLNESLSKNSIDEFKRVGHQLMGNASSFGYEDLESIAKKMEALTINDFKFNAPPLLAEFSAWIEKNRIELGLLA